MRSYAHFALPVPYLGGREIEWLDRIVCQERDWVPTLAEEGLCVARTWVGPHGGEIVLVVLGFYPVVATVRGSERERRPSRRVLSRLVEEVPRAGGMVIEDEHLAEWVTVAGERWDMAVDAARQIEQWRMWLEFAQCAACQAFTSHGASHCRTCGHRFSEAERVEHQRRREHAQQVIEDARARQTAASNGWGVLPALSAQEQEMAWLPPA